MNRKRESVNSSLISSQLFLFGQSKFFSQRLVMMISVICCIVGLILQGFETRFSNIYLYTVKWREFWRIFTAAFMPTGILNLFFSLLSFVRASSEWEKQIGTARIIIEFQIINVLVQCLFLFFNMLLSNFKGFMFYSAGLWPIIFT